MSLKRPDQTKGYMGLNKIPSSLSNYHIHHNADCVKCNAMHKEMVRVGAVIFCDKCVAEEFKSENPVTEERERYLLWLNIAYKEVDKESP